MDFRYLITITALSVFPLGLLPSGGTIAAENGNGKARAALFNENASKKIFDTKVSDSDQYDIIFVKPWEQRTKLVQKEDPQAEKNTTPPKNPEIPETKEQIIEKFGAPQEAEPLKANKDAPRPFRAMMAALNIGDEELAYQYAKKWTTYLNRLDSATDQVTGLTGKVMEKEGQLDSEKGWAANERFDKYNKHIDADIRKQLSDTEARIDNLTEYLPKSIREQVMSKRSLESQSSELFFNETKIRTAIRKALAKKIPITNKGRLDIYFFFHPKRSSSMMMAKEIEALYIKSDGGKSFNLIGVPLGETDKKLVAAFKREAGVSFPILAGRTKLPQIFQIKKNPTVLFHQPDSGLSYYEEGLRRVFYLDEIQKLIRRSALL